MKYQSERKALEEILNAVDLQDRLAAYSFYAAAKAICDEVLEELKKKREENHFKYAYPYEKFTYTIYHFRHAVYPESEDDPQQCLENAKHYLNSINVHYNSPESSDDTAD